MDKNDKSMHLQVYTHQVDKNAQTLVVSKNGEQQYFKKIKEIQKGCWLKSSFETSCARRRVQEFHDLLFSTTELRDLCVPSALCQFIAVNPNLK